jgi:malate dehydrogenase (oxaloacetate-decarboxylating)
VAAAHAIADVVDGAHLAPDYVIPSVFNRDVATAVASAVSEAAVQTGVARKEGRS